LNLDCEDFDDLVHDVISSKASEINNGGIEEQIEFLLQEIGMDELRARISEVS